MTDSEIIKALECCASVDDGCLTDCPLYGGDDSCFSTLLKPIFHLINSQKAEIERLKERDETRHKVYMAQCEELEIVKAEAAEAVKEFAERLKKSCNEWSPNDDAFYDFVFKEIDNLRTRK